MADLEYHLQTKVNEGTFKSLVKVANHKKWTLSQLIREILEEYTNNE